MTEYQDIDSWSVSATLGRGDFAVAYRVQGETGEFALKLCTTDSQVAQERLQVEIEALRQLDHRNIPTFHDSGVFEGRPYIVMSLAPGKTIKSLVEARDKVGALYGDIETMRVVAELLSAVAHVDSHGLVHRDIKDANVLADMDNGTASLIDFGFCKESGRSTMRTSDSFWRVGSARFSPPSKLDNPAVALPAHDVFAIGVIAYRMLTGLYPWTVESDEDVHALRQAMLRRPLEPVIEHNSHVSITVSSLISQLLDLDDTRRPSADEAERSIRQFLEQVDAQEGRIDRRRSPTPYAHVIRDAVHGDIRLTDYELRVLGTQEMQRLREIKQLGLTNRVYDCADHSRLSHSVGCVSRVEHILTTYERQEGVRVEDELRFAARLYALTHDVTHIPFGHTIEDEFGFFERHDNNRPRLDRLVSSEASELGALLRQTELGRATMDLLMGPEDEGGVVSQLVSGVAGADVLDYIDRDALFCGLDHKIDSAIYRQFRLQALPRSDGRRLISLIAGKYGLRVDREFAVESVLRERYAMFLKAYAHPAKIAASVLLARSLHERLRATNRRVALKEEQIEQVGDDTLLWMLANEGNAASRWPAELLRRRLLPRGVYRAGLLKEGDREERTYRERQVELRDTGIFTPEGRTVMEGELARAARIDPKHVLIYCPERAPGYRRVEHWVTQSRSASPTRQPSGIDFARRHLGLWELWVFVSDLKDARLRAVLADAAQERFGLRNEIEENRRQQLLFE